MTHTQICTGCGGSGLARAADRLPAGWKRFGAGTLCRKCKRASLVNVVISMPVVSCVELSQDELYLAFREASREARAVSNVLVRRFALADEGLGSDGRLTKWKAPPDAYHAARRVAPAFDTNSLGSLSHRLAGMYSSRRFDVHVSGTSSIMHFSRLQPVPIKGERWRAAFDEQNRPVVSLRLGSTDAAEPRDRRLTLRLAGGSEFRRQLADFRRVVSGEAVQADMRLVPRYRDGKLRGIIARMTLTRAKPNRSADRTGEMLVTLGSGALCTWQGMPPIHLDEARNLVRGNAAVVQRMADDLKHERRHPGRHRAGIVHKMHERSRRYADRMKTLLQQTASKIIGFAKRQRFSAIRLTVGDTNELPEFPWMGLVATVRAHRDASEFVIEHTATQSAKEATA